MDPRTTSPSWSPGKRVLFRFAFCYLVLYKLPFPLNLTDWGRDFLAKPYQDLWDWLVPWVGKHLLGLSIRIWTSGSGDKTYNYVQLLCFLIIAVWTGGLLGHARRLTCHVLRFTGRVLRPTCHVLRVIGHARSSACHVLRLTGRALRSICHALSVIGHAQSFAGHVLRSACHVLSFIGRVLCSICHALSIIGHVQSFAGHVQRFT